MNTRPALRVPLVAATLLVAAIALEALALGSGPTPAASLPAANPPSSRVLPGEPWIAYQWTTDTGDGIYLIRPDGTAGHLILPGTGAGDIHPDWSPVGSRLAFISDWTTLATASADGSDFTRLLTCAPPCSFLDLPAWSPDGTRILYLRDDAADGFFTRSAIEVLDIATGSPRTVLETTFPESYMYPRWSPDGTSIVVEMQRYGQPVPADGPEPHEIGSIILVADVSGPGLASSRSLTDGDTFATFPDWRASGDSIVFSTHDLGEWQTTDEASNLYTIRADGTELTQLTHFGRAETRATQPTWTPDGQRIIFTQVGKQGSSGFDLPREIAFIDADGGNLQVIEGVGATHPRLRPTP